MDLESRKQIKRQAEVLRGAQRLRCMEYLARTQWNSYGEKPELRHKNQPRHLKPLDKDSTFSRWNENGHSSDPEHFQPAPNATMVSLDGESHFLDRDVKLLNTRAPIVPTRGMSATAQLLRKFGNLHSEPLNVVHDPHRTNKGQRCKYTRSMKIPLNTELKGQQLTPRMKNTKQTTNNVYKLSQINREQVHVPLSKLRKLPTVSNISSDNGILKVIYTKSKVSNGVPSFLPSFDFELQTPPCGSQRATRKAIDFRRDGGTNVWRQKTEAVMKNTNRLLHAQFSAIDNSSVGSTDVKRTLYENPDPEELNRMLLDDPTCDQPYPDEVENPGEKLIIWPKGSSSLNTADSIATHKLPDILESLPKSHVNLRHKVQDWINNHLQCSYSLESKG